MALGLHPVIARLLCMRGLADPIDAQRFLNPSLDQLHDPFRLADMTRAVTRLEQALAARERIAIHGDYDVDGITSTVILRRALEMLGGSVVHFIPERLRTASAWSCRWTAAFEALRPRAARANWAST
jgi:single-stranded-DNA-specific exonuclease